MKSAVATLLMLAAYALIAGQAAAQHPAFTDGVRSGPDANSSLVGIVKALAWPVVALAMGIVFYRPITLFVAALGSRITRLSLFKVELELVPAAPATTMPLLDNIRSATLAAEIADSSSAMLDQVQIQTPADYVLVMLGDGTEWLTSRLFIAIVMVERMRGVKACVFVERSANSERSFLAVATIRELRQALTRRYPWLEVAWLQSLLSIYPGLPPIAPNTEWHPDPKRISAGGPPQLNESGSFTPYDARSIVARFIESLQRNEMNPDPGQVYIETEWVSLRSSKERAQWVSRELLATLLPNAAFEAWAPNLRDAPRAQLTRAVLRRPGPFVALVDGNREFSRLTNRGALLEETAAKLGEEPDDKPH
ncbi:hypothetical protein [Pseudoduganella sp. R-34]|uniref:hypothetical protein n=1 Tax=Pseudoduganella sp. R-34 TaxID=3404062 RepID=UPI003CF25B7C